VEGREESRSVLVAQQGRARSQGCEARQVALLQQFECGATTARDVIYTAFQAEVMERCGGLATAHNGEPWARGDRFGEGAGTFLKSPVFKYAHRSIPKDRAGAADGLGEAHTCSWTDVNSLPTWKEIDTELAYCSRRGRIDSEDPLRRKADEVARELQYGLRFQERARLLQVFRFEVGRADFVPERGEECEAHGAAEEEMVDLVT